MVTGASGLVGGELLKLLLRTQDYARVLAVTRRPLALEHARLANRIVAFEALESQLRRSVTCQDAYCCIGSTLRKAGSQAEFRRIDRDLVLACARAARAAGARRFVVVSSVGADPRSKSFYLSVKGETEQALSTLGFEALDIMQPGVLLGARRELRPLELAARLVMPVVNPLLQGRFAAYRGVAAGVVAAAMLGAARSGRRGIHVYAGEALRAVAQGVMRATPAGM